MFWHFQRNTPQSCTACLLLPCTPSCACFYLVCTPVLLAYLHCLQLFAIYSMATGNWKYTLSNRTEIILILTCTFSKCTFSPKYFFQMYFFHTYFSTHTFANVLLHPRTFDKCSFTVVTCRVTSCYEDCRENCKCDLLANLAISTIRCYKMQLRFADVTLRRKWP